MKKQCFAGLVLALLGCLSACASIATRADKGAYLAAYHEIIAEYETALNRGLEAFADPDYMAESMINTLMLRYACRDGGTLSYAMYDIDKNGIPELLFNYKTADTDAGVVDLYTYAGGQLHPLAQDPILGERNHMYILADGTLMVDGARSVSASVCELWSIRMDCLYMSEGGYFYANDGYAEELAYLTEQGCVRLTADEYHKKMKELRENSIVRKLSWTELPAENGGASAERE